MSADWLEHWTSQYQQHSQDGVKGGAGTKSQLRLVMQHEVIALTCSNVQVSFISSHSRSSRGAGKQVF